MQRKRLLPLLCLSFLWFGFTCYGQVITVRVIDIRNGHPLEKQRISINWAYQKGEPRPAKYDKVTTLETDIEGMVQISLPEPPPGYLQLGLQMTLEHWHCVPELLMSTQEVIQHGKVGRIPPEIKESDFPVKAKPGEIVYPARPYTFMQRLLNPIMKR